MKGINIILNTTAILMDEMVNLSHWVICFYLNYDFFILLTNLKQH